ncbi:glycoside hydrolase family 44 protein [Dyadobacter pollutisoli]|uniref:Secretion protein Por n=1 Tax=Dyadobacter pollutisoli TaxID=2910158 RepID=A0A9E8NEI1_9BACT|nr:glycoside hydrolase family 44 protein [Dyadobacter pollutisoli]WAC13506.1 secretion protein Por [Dyadobacter pollutisoli]
MKKPVLYLAKMSLILVLLCLATNTVFAQAVTVTVNATQDKRLISPNIYGKNDFLDHPVQFYKDAGLRFARMNGGNNASAYNWRAKLAVHPDWYNNVYPANWDVLAQKINTDFPDMQGMFAFQLLGRVASSGSNNFNDWGYNQSQWWSGVSQNLAGGGQVNTSGGGQALVDGNIDLFSKPWPADSSVEILNHWFGAGGLGLNKNQFQYWSMDNEVDIWNGTHDWAMPTLISASAFMDRFIELAKKAKAINPDVKICGPVTTSEWQWYKWSSESIWIDGRYYPWMEYFIKRLGDEYKATGIKLVDVLDIHNYPWYNGSDEAALQGHRIYYDENYDYPGSNGLKSSTGGWDNSLTKQYIFKRIDDWLTEHFGPNHGITPGVSEWGTQANSNPSLESVIYGSHLGTFANNGVELFSPWNWSIGMWETLHLFSRNAKEFSISSTSSDENMVSAYSSVNPSADSLTVMLINRDMNASRTVTINLNNFNAANGNYKTLQLASLPTTETFVSHTQNASQESTVAVNSNSLTITVPALSTTAILLANETTLPVNLISFSGRASSEGNVLLWSTAEEVNNEGFEVQRSLNGVMFEKIGFVAGKGTMSAQVDYQFIDGQPLGDAYYRLKQMDFDRKYTFSKTINVKNKSGIKAIVYPNPVRGVLNFDLPPAKRHLIVRNTAGLIIEDQADFSASTYETSHLPKGYYLISLGLHTFKVLVD